MNEFIRQRFILKDRNDIVLFTIETATACDIKFNRIHDAFSLIFVFFFTIHHQILV